MEPTASGSPRRSWPLLLLVIGAAVLPRLPALAEGVRPVWDDHALLVEDPRTADLGSIPGTLGGPYFRDRPEVGLYRPLVNATLTVERVVFGDGAIRAHRAVNLFLHALAAVLLFLLLRRLLPDRPVVPVLAAVIFAEHPVTTEVVAWIVARGDSGAAVLSLLAIHLHISRRPLAPLLAAGCLLLAMLFKPVAAVVPAVVVLVDAAFRGRRVRDVVRPARLIPLVLLVLPVIVVFAMRHGAVGSLVPMGEGVVLRGTTWLHRLILAGGLLVRGLLMLALPVQLTGDYGADPAWREGPWTPPAAYLLAFGLVLVAAGWLILRRRRGGVETFGLGWALMFLLPVLQIVPVGALLADRFLYLPAMGVALAAASAIDRVAGGVLAGSFRARLVGVAVGVMLSCTFALDLSRAAAYRDDGTFNRDVLRRFPDDPAEPWRPAGIARVRVRLGLDHERRAMATGDAETRRREWNLAAQQYRRAILRDPNRAHVQRRLGSLLVDAGKLIEGIRVLKTAYGGRGNERQRALVEYDLARALVKIEERRSRDGSDWRGDPMHEAEGYLKKALRRRPRFAEATFLLGKIYVRYQGRPEEGRALLRRAIELDPRMEPHARYWLERLPPEHRRESDRPGHEGRGHR